MPRLRTEVENLNSRALAWTVSAAAGAALAAFAGLIGRWSANPALGWALALAAAGLGRAAAPRAGDAADEGARAWAAAGALAALAVPALLRVLGLSLAEPALLRDPLGGASGAFVLGQAALLAAAAAAAWSRAARGAGAPGAAAALAGAAAAAAAFRLAEPSPILAAAALAVLAAAELLERPWTSFRAAPLRARAFAASAALGLGLAALAPNMLASVWMARLHAAYPGGGYLAFADDGSRLWAAYRFSNGTALMLRDGVPQTSDPRTVEAALYVLIGQRGRGTRLLLSRPPEALIALNAQARGAVVTIADGSAAEAAALDALGGGRDWRRSLAPGEVPGAPDAALVFAPRPAGRRPAGPGGFRALRARLADGAAVGLLLPPETAPRDVDAAAREAAAAFGAARIADLPKGILVAAARELLTNPSALARFENADDEALAALAADIHWRAAAPAK